MHGMPMVLWSLSTSLTQRNTKKCSGEF
uniref:Uncharacterized protein n=1 Tax=Arundo donax TaxID=35708 RepID=A0A0A9AYJ9_ARUDO